MSWACFDASGSLEYCRVTLSFAAAASAPLRMMSQNVSPGDWCVIIAIVICGVFAFPAPAALVCVACRPPPDEQAATRTTPASATAGVPRLFERFIWVPFGHHRVHDGGL